MKWCWPIATAALLAGCSISPVSGARQQQVAALLRAELAPVTPKVLAMWYGGGDPSSIVCGEIEAPPRLRSEQTRVRFQAMSDAVVLEPHLLTFDPTGAQIAAESVATFDQTWASACAPHAPLTSRVAAWFGSPRSSSPANTPLTNAYIDQALARARAH